MCHPCQVDRVRRRVTDVAQRAFVLTMSPTSFYRRPNSEKYEEFAYANYEVLTKTLFVLYMFVMPIMMINILIAMMGNTYTTVIAQAEKA
ncbi:unnamed protein product, partial [Heligmosomoides polygyrus]|uniref:Ion_trans domain-containing protein n=1 Tax=Heligmosomoides polygyrus TaxID=6339 RepID=A0A183GLE2_HELPZ